MYSYQYLNLITFSKDNYFKLMEANRRAQFLIFKKLQIIKKQIGYDLKKTYQLYF